MALDRDKLKNLMKARGVTQKMVKEATGKEARTISRWLSGRNVPKDRDVRIIAELLNCEPVEFYQNFVDTPSEGVAIHATVSAASYNAYEVMGMRYGVTQRDIMEIAPVLFSIVAGHALRVTHHDLDAYDLAKSRGLSVQLGGGGLEGQEGFELDERASETHKCFGISAGERDADPRNLFAVAVQRLCEDLDGIVDASGMRQPDPGTPLKAVGFNVDPEFLSALADGSAQHISDLTTGRLRLPPRETLARFGRGALDEAILHQTRERQDKLEAQRQESLSRLAVWQERYAAEHPEFDAEYHELAALYYEDEGFIPEGSSAEERDQLHSDPFNARRALRKGFSARYFSLLGKEDPNKKAQAERVARLQHLWWHRHNSKQAFAQESL